MVSQARKLLKPQNTCLHYIMAEINLPVVDILLFTMATYKETGKEKGSCVNRKPSWLDLYI